MRYPIPDYAGHIAGIRCFLLDLDGTVYLGGQLLPDAGEFLRRLRETGRDFAFLTNNSSKSGAEYLSKLTGMGIDITPNQVVTSGQATVQYLLDKHPGKRVYLLGGDSLKREFIGGGVTLVDTAPDIVVTAFDLALDYRRLCLVCDFVRSGIAYIGTHPDYNCPTETGFIPDIGATHAFIHASTGRWPDRIIGKPNMDIIAYALEKTGHKHCDTAIVGDRLYTDVASGVNNGLTGILVLSGETRREDLERSDIQPHMVFGGVADIIPYL